MKTITADKVTVMEVLRSNRAKHREEFLKAQEGFRKKVIEVLDKNLSDAKAGRKFSTYINLPVPHDHTEDYDRALKMLELEVGKTISLDQSDVACYIQDDWGWKGQFATTNSTYIVEE